MIKVTSPKKEMQLPGPVTWCYCVVEDADYGNCDIVHMSTSWDSAMNSASNETGRRRIALLKEGEYTSEKVWDMGYDVTK